MTLTLLFGSLFGASFATCLFSLICLFGFKLHSKFLYRLAAYQVFASLLHALSGISQVSFLMGGTITPSSSCVAVAFLYQVAGWMKLLLSAWLTLHVFSFAVFHKNLRKLEPLYITTSVLIPTVISSIPLITKVYGPSEAWCWIMGKSECESNYKGFIEQLALWFVPQSFLLVLESTAMMTMLAIVYYRAHRREEGNPLFGREQNKKAFGQLLPLVAYPIAFCVLSVPTLVYRASDSSSNVFRMVTVVCVPSWSLIAGLTLILHIAVVKENFKRIFCRICCCNYGYFENEQ